MAMQYAEMFSREDKEFVPFCLWLTGLSGSGKTTIAQLVTEKLMEINVPVQLVDGDVFRAKRIRKLGFTKRDRAINVWQIGQAALDVVREGQVAVVSSISPYRDIREAVGRRFKHYVEAYVECSLEECIRRDPKGLYAKALEGKIKGFTGISDPYEKPVDPSLVVRTEHLDSEGSLMHIIQHLQDNGLISRALLNPLFRYEQFEQVASYPM